MGEEAEVPLISENYEAKRDGSWADSWRHFTTRGHKGRVTCIGASSWADFLITGGVDYTVRCWKYNARFEAYDLVALTQMAIPDELRAPEGFSLLKYIKESVVSPKHDWAAVLKDKPRGVTSVVCSSSPHPDCPGFLRNAPVLSGNAHGDLYVTDLCRKRGQDLPPCLLALHKDEISDIITIDERSEGMSCTMLVMTGSKDKTAKILRMELEQEEAPEFNPHVPDLSEDASLCTKLVDVLFQGGGGRAAARKLIEEQEAQWNEDVGMTLDSEVALRCRCVTELNVVCQHSSAVLTVRALGVAVQDENRACFATCCEEYASLWDAKGELKTKLWLHLSNNYHTYDSRIPKCENIAINKLTGLAAVNKPHGSLLFLSGEMKDDHGIDQTRVGVWGIKDGIVGVRDQLDQGDDRVGTRSRGRLGCASTGALKHGDDAKCLMDKVPECGSLEPIAVYHQKGKLLDVDQAGKSTTFAVQLQSDGTTINMWDLEVIGSSALAIEPEGVASLLPRPGRDHLVLQLGHIDEVCDLRVVEDSDGPALVTATDEGTAFIWDLLGDDKGQVYGELRSMKPHEILLPVVIQFVSFSQVFSFAFGPSVPWKEEIHHKATIAHRFMMLDFKKDIEIPKETIFWPEMTLITLFMIMFLVFAVVDMPHLLDRACRQAHEIRNYYLRVLCMRMARNARGVCYLLMSLLSTVLVVPMIQSCAQATDCVWVEDKSLLDLITGNVNRTFVDGHLGDVYLADVPTVACYTGMHLKLVTLLWVLVPPYLLFLLPYAVCSGDAQYINMAALWDFKIWRHENAWRLAAKRKATDMHLGFLHPTPAQAFKTLSLELMGKVTLPVVTTWTTHSPMEQMVFVSIIGGILWISSIVWSPFVERKWCILVQDLKLTVLIAMVTGVITVGMDDPKSYFPVFLLSGSMFAVGIVFLVQWCSLGVEPNDVVVYCHDRKPRGTDDEAPLMSSARLVSSARNESEQAAEEAAE